MATRECSRNIIIFCIAAVMVTGYLISSSPSNLIELELEDQTYKISGIYHEPTKSSLHANGTCSVEASNLGYHQKVISFCIYGTNPNYWKGFESNLIAIKELYPGWYVRLYTKRDTLTRFTHLLKKYSHLFLCDVEMLPSPYHNISISHPMTWRFAPMADPQVDLALFRDTDSQVGQREVDAVNDWLASNSTVHVMRDHPFHSVPILAGMWGVRNTDAKRARLKRAFKKILIAGRNNDKKGYDQLLLKEYVWSEFWLDNISHDSYNCIYYFLSRSWPTRREDITDFVGSAVYIKRQFKPVNQCPWLCRPRKHKDWLYC